MSLETAKGYLQQFGRAEDVQEFTTSSATVELAAQAVGTEPARIAKTLSFFIEDRCILIVAAGDAKVDNKKYKDFFGCKAKMPPREDCLRLTGHEAGGVCPFANPPGTAVYLDLSLQRFDFVYPACGSGNSAIKLTCEELFLYANALEWIDVCKDWQLRIPAEIS